MTPQERREKAEAHIDEMDDTELGAFFLDRLGLKLCLSFLARECQRDEKEAADILEDTEALGATFREELDVVAIYLDSKSR